MSFPNSAGVYDRIVDKSFVVSAGGLLAGGIVVSAKRGPTKINTVTSAREFIETYGTPSRDNPSLYAALRFLNRAGILTVRRVINDALVAGGSVTHEIQEDGTFIPSVAGSALVNTTGIDTVAGGTIIVGGTNVTIAENATVSVVVEAINIADIDGYSAVVDGTDIIISNQSGNVSADLSAIGLSDNITSSNYEEGGFIEGETVQVPHLTISASSAGAWGNSVEVSFAQNPDLPSGVFILVVKENGEEVESFEVSRDENAKNGFGSNIYIENVINGKSRYITVEDNPSVSQSYDMTAPVLLAGGFDDTIAPTAGAIIQAWEEFENVDNVPAQILINGGWAVPAVQVKMLSVAENRKDAVAILDVPQDTAEDVAAMVDYRKNDLAANTYFGGLYGGWVKIYDQYNDREVNIAPSGDVAAVFVHTVNVAERWDAPAGLQRGIIPNALGVSKILSEGERDLLYVAGVNPVTTYGGAAAVIWGQKTLQVAASALDRFNVVNSVLWINQRIAQALQPFVFEPNTVATRDNINFLVSSFLENIQQRGGLYGFYVDTSEEINTPFVIDNNQLYVDYYLKPTRTAEFIRASAIITATGVQLG